MDLIVDRLKLGITPSMWRAEPVFVA